MSIALFILSLLSKGTAVTLSMCIIAIDYFASRKLLSRKVILEKVPYITLSLVFGLIATNAQHSADAISITNNFTWFDHVAIASYGFIQYLVKFFFPYNLSAFYPYPVKTGLLLSFQFYGCIGLVILLYTLWWFFRHNKVVIFGILFFIANISIVIQLLSVGGAIMADRYVYIPSVGFFLLIGYLSANLWRKSAILKNSVVAVLVLYVTMLGVKSYQRVNVWKDSLTLWNDAIKKYPENNTRGYLNRASALYYMNNYSLALQDYKKLLQIDPHNGGAYIGMGLSLNQSYDYYLNRASLKYVLNDFEGALADLDNAIKLNASGYEAIFDRGFVELHAGNMHNAD